MTIWEKWEPKEEIPKFMYAKSFFVNNKGLILGYEDENGKKRISFIFDRGFLSARSTYDGVLMKDLASLYVYCESGKCGHGILFKVKNSEYLQEFKKQGRRLYDSQPIEHYMIVGYDMISEVLSFSEPTIKIEDKE